MRIGKLFRRIETKSAHPASGSDTMFDGSIRNERHPEVTSQSPSEFPHKLEVETADDHGVVGKAKRIVEEMDRDLGGEYQRREDSTAPPPHGADGSK